jgi:hypothetical protein
MFEVSLSFLARHTIVRSLAAYRLQAYYMTEAYQVKEP